MLEFSSPEALRAEIEYRRTRARELAHPGPVVDENTTGWLSWLFPRHGASDRHDRKAGHRAA